jgi:prepilin-type N-terminal cleavage/methylation domain-containing protein
MKRGTPSPASAAGFTLLEMLVATVVLVILVVMVAQLTNNATSTTTNSRKHMDSDSQARTIFDRMGNDFGRMLKRADVDYIFYKNSPAGSGSPGVNDAIFFYSEVPAYYDTPPAATSQCTAALVGYRINLNNAYYPGAPVLERLGKGLTWDGSNGGTTAGGPVFLTYPAGSATPLSTSLLDGNWTTIGTAANNYTDGTDPDYHVLSDQAYRLEIAFLLNDGTTSTIPVINPALTPSGVVISGTSSVNNLTATNPPTVNSDSASDDGNGRFTPGSRWFNTATCKGYICANASPGAAVWNQIGLQDVSAVIVAIALLDTNSRKIVTNTTSMAGALRDPVSTDFTASPPQLMAQTWTSAINSGTFAASSGIPRTAASQVRVYQRYFYINGISE